MKKEKLLLIGTNQLEALTDAAMWCKYLSDDYEITHVSFEMKLQQSPELSHVQRRMVPTYFPKIIRGSLLLLFAILSILFHKGKIMVVYFEKCIYLKKLFPRRKMLLDIRTLTVFKDEALNAKYNSDIERACNVYDEVTVISHGVARSINLTRYNLLPLGAERISDSCKVYSNGIRLLYVGTFMGRKIDTTIKGLAMFHKKNKEIPISYVIIGGGSQEEELNIKASIRAHELSDIVSCIGRVPHHDLKKYFDEANLGVSFVPLLAHYQYQPPTKTFEYLMSGLYCIATSTIANKEIISDPLNGLLIQDTADSFCEALEKYLKLADKINKNDLIKSVSQYSWDVIVDTYLKKALKKL